MTRKFAHLHCHSHYSLLDGANRIPELVQQTKALGMDAIALTDHGNLYGAIEFYREATAVGINPIIGYEAYVAPKRRTDRGDAARKKDSAFHLTILASNLQGFKNLIKMSSIAFTEGYYYNPRIDKELLEAHKEGLIVLSGCVSSEFSRCILEDRLEDARATVEWFLRVFGERNFFIEIQNNGLDVQKQHAEVAIDLANKLGVPLVATCDAHYLCAGDAFAHEVLLCINTGKVLTDTKRMSYGSDQFYVQSPEEMYRRFPDHADAVARSQEIADRCEVRLDFKTRHFPVYTPPQGLTAEQYLRQLAYAGMRERYGESPREEVVQRLEHELNIICRMGFAGYFLIVWDFVDWAIRQGIPCSARGSGCGAVVCYVLKLSHVDPLEYDLLFERFLDPNRSEAPDIDIDFCQDRREEVIEYVKQKYGHNSVAQIATFGTLAAKAAIKDVGRVLGIPLERVNYMTKWVSPKPGATIAETIRDSAEFRKEYETDSLTRRWIDTAIKLEGTNRNAGTHAAGVVIANGPITDYVPIHRVIRKGDDSGIKSDEYVITTQWVMGDLEKVGMLKMDFLGLRTLTVLNNAVRLIEKTRGVKIDLYKLPIDDPATYALLQRGDAKGVFQFESQGIRDLLRRLKPDNIRDIIACTALYRPGPLEGGMVDDYIDCKHGRKKPVYLHPVMETILGETFGVMNYQEQVMRVLNCLGGIELSSAYACIKAISKKKQEIIDARKIDFIKGAQERGLSAKQAEEIFNLIVKFGGYGFNKSHSAAYAYVSYQTAYLKTHYTPEYMAALLSSEVDDGNKRDILVEHIQDARAFGVEVLEPNINTCEADFTVQDGKILFGLAAIKGLGRGAANAIVAERKARGPFVDLFDFCERVDPKLVNRAAIEKLIKAGAFDCFGKNTRAAHFAALNRAVQSAQGLHRDPLPRPTQFARCAGGRRPHPDAAPHRRVFARGSRMADGRETPLREGGAGLLLFQPSARRVPGRTRPVRPSDRRAGLPTRPQRRVFRRRYDYQLADAHLQEIGRDVCPLQHRRLRHHRRVRDVAQRV
jgi:DNA polymerase-3 subunit alpha